ncbi:hypothetical protein D3C84_982820 [compost metagenome]
MVEKLRPYSWMSSGYSRKYSPLPSRIGWAKAPPAVVKPLRISVALAVVKLTLGVRLW